MKLRVHIITSLYIITIVLHCTSSSKMQDHAQCTKSCGRAILTEQQAQTIFRFKPSPFSKARDRACILAKMFGISVKTVRDIWVGRTWYRATYHLDPSIPPASHRLVKRAGRPKGSKDRKPRTKKYLSCPNYSEPNQVNKEETETEEDCNTDEPNPTYKFGTEMSISVSSGFKSSSPEPVPIDIWLFDSKNKPALFEDPFRDDWPFWPTEN